MNLRRIFIISILIFLTLYVVYLMSLFAVNYVNYDILTLLAFFEYKRGYIVCCVFVLSMLIGYVVNLALLLFERKKQEYKFINVDEFASSVYRKLFDCFINKKFDELSEICEEECISNFRFIYNEDIKGSVPLIVNCNVTEYDHDGGVIVVVCTGSFADNTISRHRLKFVRNNDEDVYMLNDFGGF